MLELRRANLFESDAIALVNTVNCVGVMGKGIAYQFARAYPAYAKDYMRRCKAEEVRLGSVYSFTEAGRVLISFPTKGHWKARSRLPDIEEGLISLRALIEREGLKSVAVPPLGCGNGGLSWADVKPLIIKHLGDLHDVQISVYEPAGDASAPTGRPPKLSLGHYVLVALRLRLTERTKLNLQKAAYFFNVFTKSQFH
jgi:O-acetyl-ADP-ribose deacetylase (regulator of RNase III)